MINKGCAEGEAMKTDTPVLIVGAGTTGLCLAVELARANVPFRIIDKKKQLTETDRALVVQPRTLEVLDDQQLLQEALTNGHKLKGISLYDQAKKLTSITTYNLPTLYPYLIALPQYELEKIYFEYLTAQNVTIEFDTELVQVTERIDVVNAVVKSSDGTEQMIKTNWLVACDGFHSTVRDRLHMQFSGQELQQSFFMADITFQSNLPKEEIEANLCKQGTLIFIPLSQTKARIVINVSQNDPFHTNTHPSEVDIRRLFQERCALKVMINEILWQSYYSLEEKMINRYKQNAIFFAGSAAHVHSPLGAQGMNTGIQDAYNLGWKLAAVVDHRMAPSVLETYQLERYPVAQRVLTVASVLTRIIGWSSLSLIKLRNMTIKILSKQTTLNQKFLQLMSQLTINYNNSPLTREAIPTDSGPKAGDRFLDCHLDDKNIDRLLNYVRGSHMTLLFFAGGKDKQAETLTSLMKTIYLRYENQLKYQLVVGSEYEPNAEFVNIISDHHHLVHNKYKIHSPRLYVLRPDKYFGFRGGLNDKERLLGYLESLLGTKVAS